jgi:hypothetical protein
MSRIIAARFETFDQAQQAAQILATTHVAGGEVDVRYVNPPGQHATYPIGGDVGADEGAKGAGGGALLGGGAGAVVGAAVAAPIAGPLGAAAGAGVGAYLGSLAGTLAVLSDRAPEQPQESPEKKTARAAGVLVTVCVDHTAADRVIDALRSFGGQDIEVADGRWSRGRWADFDPVKPPILVDAVREPAGRS